MRHVQDWWGRVLSRAPSLVAEHERGLMRNLLSAHIPCSWTLVKRPPAPELVAEVLCLRCDYGAHLPHVPPAARVLAVPVAQSVSTLCVGKNQIVQRHTLMSTAWLHHDRDSMLIRAGSNLTTPLANMAT